MWSVMSLLCLTFLSIFAFVVKYAGGMCLSGISSGSSRAAKRWSGGVFEKLLCNHRRCELSLSAELSVGGWGDDLPERGRSLGLLSSLEVKGDLFERDGVLLAFRALRGLLVVGLALPSLPALCSEVGRLLTFGLVQGLLKTSEVQSRWASSVNSCVSGCC